MFRSLFKSSPTLRTCYSISKCPHSSSPSSATPTQHAYTVQNVEDQLCTQALAHYGFSPEESSIILSQLNDYHQTNLHRTILASLECWHSTVRIKKFSHEKNHQQFRNAFVRKDPRLVLMQPSLIQERVGQLKSLDLVRGGSDLWQALVKAPTAFYIQDWNDFLKKYYFITFKVLPWLDAVEKSDMSVHPLIVCPNVMEQSYTTIKSRFLFASRTGVKDLFVEPRGNFKARRSHHNQVNNKVDFHALMLMPMQEFIKQFTPGVRFEEYTALEALSSTETGQEDDALFEDLVQLAPKSRPVKEFLEENLL